MHKIGFFLTFLLLNSTVFAQNGLSFDDIDDMIQTNFPGILGNNPITVEAWIKPTANSGESIITSWGTVSNGARFTVRCNALSSTSTVLRVENNGGGINGTTNVADGIWHHVAVVYNPSLSTNKYSLYVDGNLEISADISTPLNIIAGTNLRIGRRIHPTYTGYYGGEMDEVRIWNVARSQAEILANMNTEFCVIPINLVSYFKFNQGIAGGSNTSINMATNEVGGYNGTLTGFALIGTSSNWVNGVQLTQGTITNNVNVTACFGSSYNFNGTNYTTAGIYTHNIPSGSVNGCDSTVVLNLTFLPEISSNQTIDICYGDSVVINGVTYSSSGQYTQILAGQSSSGCDSTLSLNINVLPQSMNTITMNECYGFSLDLNGNTYYTSGVYNVSLGGASSTGCDSLIILNLTIAPEINTTIDQIGEMTLFATNGQGSYQWIDCTSGTEIAGENNQNFTSSVNGNYAVIITQNNCSDTSNCINLDAAKLSEYALDFQIFPNPANRVLNLKATQNEHFTYQLWNIQGEQLMSGEAIGSTEIDIQGLSSGCYQLEIHATHSVSRQQILKH
jgi:hypothetical protein